MGILLAFAPFLIFALVDRLAGSPAGLIAGALASAILLARDALSSGRSPKILEIGTFVLFGGLAAYSVFVQPSWSIVGIRLCVDIGLLAIVLLSMVLHQPFTLQYARESVEGAAQKSPQFVRTNYVITAAWAAAFAVMVVADLVMLYRPDVPMKVGIITTIAALYAAIKFTAGYPKYVQVKSLASLPPA
jgi:hypothetical protein